MKLPWILLVLIVLLSACNTPVVEEEIDSLVPLAQSDYDFSIDVIIGTENTLHPSPDTNVIPADGEFSITAILTNTGTATLNASDGRVFVTRLTNPAVFGLTSLKDLETYLPEDITPGETMEITFEGLVLNEQYLKETGHQLEINFCFVELGHRYEKCAVKREIYTVG